ncbi:NADH-dependent [FeFe] hydrogenase, group A6 [Selenomonas sputigena]|uniref:NADH-dependent [FeFe] hydrogenase, group A6 n=1 Tax=Selenomonas sputigena TaxID=69823 RepID=UPI00222F78D6|nr:NADH-dependent [FeFe] hydrogenase, group A6 [Selenomonas sputigena]UZD44140.1 NADH-dependent [FeFe] hydrogenase, group A6 [Selenomonas sputigena]
MAEERELVHLKINNIPVEVPKGTKIIDAARKVHINIPHLCYHPDQRVKARCRICSIEVTGSRRLMAACATEVWEGMEVHTDTQIVRDTQIAILQLILANHNQDCLNCPRNHRCDLQELCSRFNIGHTGLPIVVENKEDAANNPSIARDPTKCIKCGRCIRACKDVQGIEALNFAGRSDKIVVTTAYDSPLEATDCILCGQCSLVCPTGAITEKDDTQRVLDALQDPKKHVIVQVAPAVRVSLGDEFHLPPGAIVTGQMVAALKRLGFDRVFDTNFGADLTIMEEGHEFLHRLEHGGTLPMMTSCSPGWVNYVEKHYSDLLPHLSTAKSPMQIFGAVAKTYYPKQSGIPVEDIVTVSVMPCTAKKFEAARPEMGRDGHQDVDIVITTRELAKLIHYVGITFHDLPEEDFDSPLGTCSGAGAIFGTTGGVMEAALRTVYEKATGKTLPSIDFLAMRGMDGIKEAIVDLGERKVRVAVAHTLKNAKHIMDELKAGKSPYDFIEVMACPGGCQGGGGQPLNTTNARRTERMKALYEIDKNLPVRKSHENPEVVRIYKEFLGAPLKGKAHELLHTHFHKVEKLYDFTGAGK